MSGSERGKSGRKSSKFNPGGEEDPMRSGKRQSMGGQERGLKGVGGALASGPSTTPLRPGAHTASPYVPSETHSRMARAEGIESESSAAKHLPGSPGEQQGTPDAKHSLPEVSAMPPMPTVDTDADGSAQSKQSGGTPSGNPPPPASEEERIAKMVALIVATQM